MLICDDHTLVRSGLRRLLETDEEIEIVADVGSADEAVRAARLEKPDVVVLDVVMPGKGGLDVLGEIRQAAPQGAILMLSMQDDPEYVREAFAGGATGYLLKEAADEELTAAIRVVANGQRYVYPPLGARLAMADAETQAKADADPLSDREHEILRLLALGHTNQEIARMLFLSVRTVETHRAHVMQKLRLTTRAELVHYALENGILEEPAS